MLASPIAFHPVLARISGSVTAGLMLSQGLYWAKVLERTNPTADGWFYKTQAQWTAETCLSRWEQDGARKLLRGFSFWNEKRKDAPPKSYFRVDMEKLIEVIAGNVEKPHSRLRENLAPEGGKTPVQTVRKQHSLIGTKNTSEISREFSTRGGELFEETVFETWWDSYPRKLDRLGCLQIWNGLSVLDRAAAFDGLNAWRESAQWQEKKFIPHPATFLRRRQWESTPVEDGNASGTRNRRIISADQRTRDNFAVVGL